MHVCEDAAMHNVKRRNSNASRPRGTDSSLAEKGASKARLSLPFVPTLADIHVSHSL